MPANCTFKNGYDGKLYVMGIIKKQNLKNILKY